MRNAFADEITKLAERDPRIVLLSGDIGNRLFDKFKATFPDRFYNCGVAEANMIGVAAGLAQTGMRPIAYTIAPFLTYRCMEQIRVDLGYHHLPVTLVGTGAGLSYASLGATHHSCEDIGMLRTIPGMSVLAPADAQELRVLLRQCFLQEGPVYMRIGKKGEPLVHETEPDLTLGRAYVMRPGKDVTFVVTGNMMPTALASAAQMKTMHGIDCEVVSMHTVKPLDTDFLTTLIGQRKGIISLEEHSLIGGLGSAIAEWAMDNRVSLPCLRLACHDAFIHKTTEQESARQEQRLDLDSVIDRSVKFFASLR